MKRKHRRRNQNRIEPYDYNAYDHAMQTIDSANIEQLEARRKKNRGKLKDKAKEFTLDKVDETQCEEIFELDVSTSNQLSVIASNVDVFYSCSGYTPIFIPATDYDFQHPVPQVESYQKQEIQKFVDLLNTEVQRFQEQQQSVRSFEKCWIIFLLITGLCSGLLILLALSLSEGVFLILLFSLMAPITKMITRQYLYVKAKRLNSRLVDMCKKSKVRR